METCFTGIFDLMFQGVFAQIGKNMSKKALGKTMPFVGAVIGALFDTSQMKTVFEYADIFYNKRFLLEKEARINVLTGAAYPLEAVVTDIPEEQISHDT